MNQHIVTELDFRMPEYRHAKPEDYEFRADGALVRKDRWETGIHKIASLMGLDKRGGFEIKEVIEAVQEMCSANEKQLDWTSVCDGVYPRNQELTEIELKNGSILCGAKFFSELSGRENVWLWIAEEFNTDHEGIFALSVIKWRRFEKDEATND